MERTHVKFNGNDWRLHELDQAVERFRKRTIHRQVRFLCRPNVLQPLNRGGIDLLLGGLELNLFVDRVEHRICQARGSQHTHSKKHFVQRLVHFFEDDWHGQNADHNHRQ